MLELASVIESFLVSGLDGGDTGFKIPAPNFKVVVHLPEVGFSCFSASELDFEIVYLLPVSRPLPKVERNEPFS